jgi:hypothetical protein
VGTRCSIEIPRVSREDETAKSKWCKLTRIYPEDINRRQCFDLEIVEGIADRGIESLRLVFEESSDFFGRITVYDLQVEGHRL